MKKGTTTVGHIPRKISCICFTFLRRGGTIHCTVTEQRRYSADLPQGGLEIPCLLEFVGKANDVAKVAKILAHLLQVKRGKQVHLLLIHLLLIHLLLFHLLLIHLLKSLKLLQKVSH